MAAPLARIQIEALRRPRAAAGTSTALAASATPPAPPAPPARPAAAEPTFRQAVAAAKGQAVAEADAEDEARPRRRQAPYMVAAAILDERADAGSLTPAQLAEAMAGRGVIVSQSTAQALLRELRSPLSTRISNRRPTRQPRPTGTGNGRPGDRPR